MKDSSPTVIRSQAQPWPRSHLFAALTAACLPLLGMGVCLAPVWQWQATSRGIAELRERVSGADTRALQQDPRSSKLLLDAAAEVQAELLALLPSRFDRVELFSLVRSYAQDVGVQLQTLQLGKDGALGITTRGLDVARLELELRGTGPANSIAGLLERLDRAGYPAEVESLTLSTRSDGGSDILLKIGLFHWTPAKPATDADQDR